MTDYHLVFVHGWGFDSTFWNPVRACLPTSPQSVVDLGYFGAEAPWPTAILEKSENVVAIGHSFGVMHALAQMPDRPVALVSINGFARFCDGADFIEGVAARIVDRMLKRLERDPSAVVDEFRQRCAAPSAGKVARGAPLQRDLRKLRESDLREAILPQHRPLLVLAGMDDPIVPTSMTRATFTAPGIRWRERAGHVLPISDPVWCAEQLCAFINSLNRAAA